jgi:hypothetical protein
MKRPVHLNTAPTFQDGTGTAGLRAATVRAVLLPGNVLRNCVIYKADLEEGNNDTPPRTSSASDV